MSTTDLDEWVPTGTGQPIQVTDDPSSSRWPTSMSSIAALVCAIPLAGSGSLQHTFDADALEVSSPAFVLTGNVPRHQRAVSSMEASEALAAIRATLGTNITQTAQVLRVSRPTVYAWMHDRTEIQLAKRIRLQQVRVIADQWQAHGQGSLRKHLGHLMRDGRSLLDALSDEQLDADEIQSCFDELAGLAPRRMSPQAWAQSKGIELPSKDEQQSAIDRETGKRLSED